MNKTQIRQLVKEQIREIIGLDTEPVSVNQEAAEHIHQALLSATEGVMTHLNQAIESADSDTLINNLEKIKQEYIAGVQSSITIMKDLLEMERGI
jgi:DNA-binding MurR/RpiR family transcriptional regulator